VYPYILECIRAEDKQFSPCRNETIRMLGRTPFLLLVVFFRVLHICVTDCEAQGCAR
jgi:hypothetical protein